MNSESSAEIPRLLRELTPRVLGAVLRRYRGFDATEDAVQEALLSAAVAWPRDGLPDNPRAWLIQVAFRRLTDVSRSERAIEIAARISAAPGSGGAPLNFAVELRPVGVAPEH